MEVVQKFFKVNGRDSFAGYWSFLFENPQQIRIYEWNQLGVRRRSQILILNSERKKEAINIVDTPKKLLDLPKVLEEG